MGGGSFRAVTVAGPGKIEFTTIFCDGVEPRFEGDEYAEIKNTGGLSINHSGWRLNASDPGQNFYFPNYTIAAGQTCRIYTDEYHSECVVSTGVAEVNEKQRLHDIGGVRDFGRDQTEGNTMSELTKYQIYDLLNRPGPLWLVGIDLSATDLHNADLSGAIMPDCTIHK